MDPALVAAFFHVGRPSEVYWGSQANGLGGTGGALARPEDVNLFADGQNSTMRLVNSLELTGAAHQQTRLRSSSSSSQHTPEHRRAGASHQVCLDRTLFTLVDQSQQQLLKPEEVVAVPGSTKEGRWCQVRKPRRPVDLEATLEPTATTTTLPGPATGT